MEAMNKLFGIIPEGSRKLVICVFSLVALVLMHLLGDVTAQAALAALWKLVGLYYVGNGAEHVGKGIARLPGKGDGTAAVPNGEGGRSTILALVVVGMIVVLAMAFWPAQAKADVLPFIDKLDLQIGPGIEIVDVKPLTIDEVLLGTAKVYERWKLEVRVGGLLSDSRRALIFNVARNLSDLIVRDDGGEDKSLLPTVGIWFAGDIVRDVEDKTVLDFIFGFNAVLAEY
jgi:hypothetical protein